MKHNQRKIINWFLELETSASRDLRNKRISFILSSLNFSRKSPKTYFLYSSKRLLRTYREFSFSKFETQGIFWKIWSFSKNRFYPHFSLIKNLIKTFNTKIMNVNEDTALVPLMILLFKMHLISQESSRKEETRQ